MKNEMINIVINRLEREKNLTAHWYSNKRILVTGGAGFIGSWLVKALTALGSQVYIVDNLWRGSMDNLRDEDGNMVVPVSEQFTLGDLHDYQVARNSIKKSQPDIVFHLADIVAGINYVFSHEPFIFRTNMLINSNVFSACQEEKVPRVVYLGTACSYPKELQLATGAKPLQEDQVYPANPESGYGWSKLMGEYELQLIAKYSKIDIGILRLHNVYGPGSVLSSKRSQVIPSLIRKAIHFPKEAFIVWGSGKQTRDFIFVGDVIDALLRLPLMGLNRGVIQVSSAQETSVADLASAIVKISKKAIPINYDITKPEGDVGRCGDFSKASEILGWKPFTPLEEGLRITYEWAEKYIMDGKLDD
jgi:GDP-D-mannose 3', 5'-epimerase